MTDRILVSTHDLQKAGRLREHFRDEGYRVELVTPGEEIEDREAALLILTGGLGGEDVPDLVAGALEGTEVPVVGFSDSPVPPMTPLPPGVSDVFEPSATPDEVALVARRVMGRRRLQEVTGIVGETDAMREVLERVVQIAPVDSTVLITGESGTGKELVARGIHALSPRRHKPFIAMNVAALTDTLLESEVFGHEKGAFTGAIDSRRGFFELAHKGTVFMDEIGEMPLSTQTKLLRVLEEREFTRVGGEEPIKVDVRIIAATNQDLRQLVTLGEFRKDLYYRLNVLHIELPPLRARPADIPLLVRRFIREVTERNDRPFVGMSAEAMEILQRYRWPGNIRELRNLVESMVVLNPGREIQAADIPREVRSPGRGSSDLLPVRVARAESQSGDAGLRPQLEFIFRTLVEMRMDMDDLRKEFEEYRSGHEISGPPHVGVLGGVTGFDGPRVQGLEALDVMELAQEGEVPGDESPDPPTVGDGDEASVSGGSLGGAEGDDGIVVYRPGMTMEDMEREAIVAALREVDGNRRKAAELLGIGERTLYRKIRKFDLDA
jgi:DNA-binding NtrC family response regulator